MKEPGIEQGNPDLERQMQHVLSYLWIVFKPLDMSIELAVTSETSKRFQNMQRPNINSKSNV